MFHNRNQPKKAIKTKKLEKLIHVITAKQGLVGEKRQVFVGRFKELMIMDDRFMGFCQPLLNNLIEYYQDLPETRNSYFAQRGGLIDHAFSRTEAALSMCRTYFIQDEKNKALSDIQQLWMYTLFTAALLQGIGKLIIDLKVDCFNESGEYTKPWNPLQTSLFSSGTYYQYDFSEDKPDDFRRRLNLLLARQLMPKVGFDWIAKNQDVLEVWLALLNEDFRSAGTLGPIIIRADALAIERYFNEKQAENFAKESNKSRYSRLGTTFNPAADSEGIASGAGAEFIKWLTNALSDGKIMINKAPLFMVPGGMLMCSDIYKYFVREHPEFQTWMQVQQGFIDMKLHTVAKDGQVVQRFEQQRGQKVMSGAVLANYAMVLPDKVNVINPHTGAQTSMSSVEFINAERKMTNFSRQKTTESAGSIQHLNSDGQWVDKPTAKQSKPTAGSGLSG